MINAKARLGHGCSLIVSQILHTIYLRTKVLKIWIFLQAWMHMSMSVHMHISMHLHMHTHAQPSVCSTACLSTILFVGKLSLCPSICESES